jgi:hypothetical protein
MSQGVPKLSPNVAPRKNLELALILATRVTVTAAAASGDATVRIWSTIPQTQRGK